MIIQNKIMNDTEQTNFISNAIVAGILTTGSGVKQAAQIGPIDDVNFGHTMVSVVGWGITSGPLFSAVSDQEVIGALVGGIAGTLVGGIVLYLSHMISSPHESHSSYKGQMSLRAHDANPWPGYLISLFIGIGTTFGSPISQESPYYDNIDNVFLDHSVFNSTIQDTLL